MWPWREVTAESSHVTIVKHLLLDYTDPWGTRSLTLYINLNCTSTFVLGKTKSLGTDSQQSPKGSGCLLNTENDWITLYWTEWKQSYKKRMGLLTPRASLSDHRGRSVPRVRPPSAAEAILWESHLYSQHKPTRWLPPACTYGSLPGGFPWPTEPEEGVAECQGVNRLWSWLLPITGGSWWMASSSGGITWAISTLSPELPSRLCPTAHSSNLLNEVGFLPFSHFPTSYQCFLDHLQFSCLQVLLLEISNLIIHPKESFL